MDKGIYTALSGGIAKAHELELLANNLANVNTPGFKRDTGTFNEYLTELRRPDSPEGLRRDITAESLFDGRPSGDKSFVEMDGVYTDFSQGNLEKTNRGLDVGIEGKGFFEVLTPSGVRYTRQGNFSINQNGQLVTVNGFAVLARGASNDVPAEQRVIRLGQGPVSIGEDGSITQNGQRVADLSVSHFHESQWLEKTGNGYYRNTDPSNLGPASADSRLHQGYIEGSNVNPVREMTKLIEATRAYESHMQAIKTYQEIDGKTVSDIVKG
jgi:flagellar basal-body rod protein FlgG